MSDDDLRARFAALNDSVTPLERAASQIDRAVVRRRRRPAVVGGTLAAAAAVTSVSVALLPGLNLPSLSSGTASVTGDTASYASSEPTMDGEVGFVPIAVTGRTVGEWASAADAVVVVSAHESTPDAAVTEVPWHRVDAPRVLDLDSVPLDDDGALALGTVAGLPSEVPLSPGADYLVAIRWDAVRCDGEASGWVTLGDGAVLAMSDGAVRAESSAEPGALTGVPADPDTEVEHAFAALSGAQVGDVLDTLDLERAADLCG